MRYLLIQRRLKQSSPPTSAIEVRSFLGLVGYYCCFIKDFFTIAIPLTKLLRKNVNFEWIDEWQDIFEKLKACLTLPPVLTLPSGVGGFVVYSDTSQKSLDCVLMQQKKVITCTFIQFRQYKLNYLLWYRVNYNCICLKNIEAQPLWWDLSNFYRSQEFKVSSQLKRVELETRFMDWIVKGLWLYYWISYRQGEYDSRCP